MKLGDLKYRIESHPQGTCFSYSLSDPFSWRGVYAEVAFTVLDERCCREELLEKINRALSDEFIGWKGGEYFYNKDTPVHFEERHGDYSNGDYSRQLVSEILSTKVYRTPESHLIDLIFPEPL